MTSPLTRAAARFEAAALRAACALVDGSPDVVRYGPGHAARRILWERPLPQLGSTVQSVHESLTERMEDRSPTVALVTRSLNTGGVEAVVEMLALGFAGVGLAPMVLCERGGATADRIRARGVEVVEVRDKDAAKNALRARRLLSVAQLHNAPEHLIDACLELDLAIVPVLHTTDVNLRVPDWTRLSALVDRSAATIAVSETVREFTERNLPRQPETPIVVVTNAAPSRIRTDRDGSRRRLGQLIDADLGNATVFVSLARYDIQKNIPGLVQAFLRAIEGDGGDTHLVVAGPVEDWLEYALADAHRRGSAQRDHVHLIGSSSSSELLGAADAFILDSFFEGWPVAASEAVLAGIPVVLAETGGANELSGDGRGVVCDNPAGNAADVTRISIRRARRRRVQRNRDQLAQAVREVARDVGTWRERRSDLSADAAQWLSAKAMVGAHAKVLGGIVRARGVLS